MCVLLLPRLALDRVGLYHGATNGLFVVGLNSSDDRLELLGLDGRLDVVARDQSTADSGSNQGDNPHQGDGAAAHLHTAWEVITRRTALPTARTIENQA